MCCGLQGLQRRIIHQHKMMYVSSHRLESLRLMNKLICDLVPRTQPPPGTHLIPNTISFIHPPNTFKSDLRAVRSLEA